MHAGTDADSGIVGTGGCGASVTDCGGQSEDNVFSGSADTGDVCIHDAGAEGDGEVGGHDDSSFGKVTGRGEAIAGE